MTANRIQRPPKPTYQSLMKGGTSDLTLGLTILEAQIHAFDIGDTDLVRALSPAVIEATQTIHEDPNAPMAYTEIMYAAHNRAVARFYQWKHENAQ